VKQFEFKFPKAKLEPVYTDEITGLQKIKDLKTCLLITTRGLTEREIAYLKTKRQLPEVFPIGYDGIAFIVNKNNNDTCISVKDIKRILRGQVKQWNQILSEFQKRQH
jgi:phosphate transport system substrate-binding protein